MLHEEFLKLKENKQHGNFLMPYVWYKSIMPDYYTSYPMHWHDEFEIIYIKSGKMNMCIDLENYVVTEGDIVLIKPKQLHSFSQYENETVETITVVFSLSMLTSQITDACSMKYFSPLLEGKLDFPSIIRPNAESYRLVHDCLLDMHNTFNANENFYELSIKANLFKLFYTLLRDYCSEYISSPHKVNETTTIKKIIEYIQTNYMHQITIAELANAAGLSDHYLMRYFKANMGITCVEYINEYRLNIATHMLSETDYPVGIIAEKCGVPNVSYFNRIFKKAFNITPKEYRRNKQ